MAAFEFVSLLAATDRALPPLKFIMRNMPPKTPLASYTLVSSWLCAQFCFISLSPSLSLSQSIVFSDRLRLFADMSGRDYGDLSPMLYSCGFPCQPLLGNNYLFLAPLLLAEPNVKV